MMRGSGSIHLLDAGSLGLACSRPGVTSDDRCRAWLVHLEFSAGEFMIPAVADYEVCGELLGLGAIAELRRLDALRSRSGGLDVRAAAFDQAAEFWALLRRGGLQTAGDAELNGDAILAVVAVNLNGHGDVVTIAMNHMGHIERFPGVEAREWHTIS